MSPAELRKISEQWAVFNNLCESLARERQPTLKKFQVLEVKEEGAKVRIRFDRAVWDTFYSFEALLDHHTNRSKDQQQ